MSAVIGLCTASAAEADLARSPMRENIWTANATRFMYPPRLAFPAHAGATNATCGVEGADGSRHVLAVRDGVVDLASAWESLPVGNVQLAVKSEKGESKRFFWKKAMFKEGAYGKARCGYGESAAKCFRYLMDMPALRYLAEKGEPDPDYELNCYPSKMMSAVARGFARHAEKCPQDAERALRVAKSAADWLISASGKDGSALPGIPPTYMGDRLTAKANAGLVMTSYPCAAASAYITLGRRTGEAKYIAAAKRIAEVYLRLQGADGTWPLVLRVSDGSPAAPNRLLPTTAVEMFEALYAETRDGRYREAADRAFGYFERGPMADWNWEGQFEDVRPSPAKYHNLTKHDACSAAIYALARFPGDARWIAFARDAARFAEDQFVDWEVPYGGADLPPVWGEYGNRKWMQKFSEWRCPAAVEQYECYVPVDASAAKIIRTFLALYRATGEALYLKKARALGDEATIVQRDDGSYPTWWRPDSPYHADWLNCMIATAGAMELLAETTD